MAVPGAIALCKELTDDRFTGEGRERDGGNEFLTGRCNEAARINCVIMMASSPIDISATVSILLLRNNERF